MSLCPRLIWGDGGAGVHGQGAQAQALAGDVQHRFAGHYQDMAAIGHDDLVGELPVAGVFARVDHRMHLAEHAEAGGEGEVHRGGAQLLGIAPSRTRPCLTYRVGRGGLSQGGALNVQPG